MTMQVIPAIDVLRGRVVRLLRGDFARVTVYGDDPAAIARRWHDEGASLIHVVDLEGARSGAATPGLAATVAEAGVRFQLGGGLRDTPAVQEAVAAGAARVVVGTAIVEDPASIGSAVAAVGADRVVAALDVKAGEVLGSGWVGEGRRLDATAVAVAAQGVRWALVTGIARDGTMAGPDLGVLEAVRRAAPGLSLIASGGVGGLDDVRALADAGVEAVVVGRALYEGRFTLAAAAAAAVR